MPPTGTVLEDDDDVWLFTSAVGVEVWADVTLKMQRLSVKPMVNNATDGIFLYIAYWGGGLGGGGGIRGGCGGIKFAANEGGDDGKSAVN